MHHSTPPAVSSSASVGTPTSDFSPPSPPRAGDRGPDRHGATRESLAELVIMARPLHENEDDASASEIDGDDSGGIRTLARGVSVTSVDDETLRDWARVGHASAEVIILRRVTDFHLGLNAHRWLKIRMRQIADGAESLAATEASTVSRDSRATLGVPPRHRVRARPLAPGSSPPAGRVVSLRALGCGREHGYLRPGHGVRRGVGRDETTTVSEPNEAADGNIG